MNKIYLYAISMTTLDIMNDVLCVIVKKIVYVVNLLMDYP